MILFGFIRLSQIFICCFCESFLCIFAKSVQLVLLFSRGSSKYRSIKSPIVSNHVIWAFPGISESSSMGTIACRSNFFIFVSKFDWFTIEKVTKVLNSRKANAYFKDILKLFRLILFLFEHMCLCLKILSHTVTLFILFTNSFILS